MAAVVALVAVTVFGLPVRADAAVVESLGGARISRDDSARTYTLGAGGASLTLAIDRSADYQLVSLESPTGRKWTPSAAPDTWVVINGKAEPLGSRAANFDYERVTTENTGHSLVLHAAYRYRPGNIRVIRHVSIVDGSPTFEMWTSFEYLGTEATISDLNGFELKVNDGNVRWLSGLQGSASDTPNNAAFTLQSAHVGQGEAINLSASGRSSESAVPWFAIDGDDDEFFAGFLWSGAWSLNVFRSGETLALSLGLINMSTQLSSSTPIEAPHVVFGAARGRLAQASEALRRYLIAGVRAGRGFSPLVTYNTWFADGTRIDDRSVRGTMARAASLGTELFVLDAGWYAGAGAEGVFDFHSGLGRWQPDPDRFPEGLGALSDHAHELGMKFGIWVEPERINLDVLDEEGVDSGWLATDSGRQVTERTGQVCLAGEAGRRWVWERLTSFIDQVHPDYLKWDNNAWLNCNAEGHGHGISDGNYAHVNALYGILKDLRERYPDLLIENVSGGGNRLDFGMLRYTDTGWMDDRSGPSAHVRHNLQGLSAAFPPAYLFSFVTTQDEGERLTSYQDLALYFRSRMMGVLGMSFSLAGLSTDDAMAREIQTYKELRGILNDSAGTVLTEQAQMDGGPPWDVYQATTGDGSSALVFAFQAATDSGNASVKPTALIDGATYTVDSVDFGALGAASAADLMADGIEVYPGERTAAHILILRKVDEAP